MFFEKKHKIILQSIYKYAHKKSLTQLSPDTGEVTSHVHTATELLNLKPYIFKCIKTPGSKLYCKGTVLYLVLRSSVQW
jgi:hypothetical protein